MVWRIDKQYKHAQRYREITEILIKNGLGYLLDRFNLHPYQKLKQVIRRKKPVPSTDEAKRLRKSLEELDPDYNFAELAEPYIKRLIKQKTQPKTIAKNTMETLVQTVGTLHKAPSRIDKILKRIERGTLKIEFEDRGIREVTTELGASTNRLAVSIIISALIIGSSMFIQKDLQPQIYGVTLIGMVGFLIAGVLAFGLAINILQSGKI